MIKEASDAISEKASRLGKYLSRYQDYLALAGADGEWYKMEQLWANALKEQPPKTVSVKINSVYLGDSLRPDRFNIEYRIEGKKPVIKIIRNKAGG